LAVLGAALALPASTAAAGGYVSAGHRNASTGYKYRVMYSYCSGSTVNFKVRNIAKGYTPANKLTIDSWAQRRKGGRWQTVYTWARAKYTFPVNGYTHKLTSYRSYIGNDTYLFRIVFRLRAWHNKKVLATTTLHSVKC
jgi:hypothetical protein